MPYIKRNVRYSRAGRRTKHRYYYRDNHHQSQSTHRSCNYLGRSQYVSPPTRNDCAARHVHEMTDTKDRHCAQFQARPLKTCTFFPPNSNSGKPSDNRTEQMQYAFDFNKPTQEKQRVTSTFHMQMKKNSKGESSLDVKYDMGSNDELPFDVGDLVEKFGMLPVKDHDNKAETTNIASCKERSHHTFTTNVSPQASAVHDMLVTPVSNRRRPQHIQQQVSDTESHYNCEIVDPSLATSPLNPYLITPASYGMSHKDGLSLLNKSPPTSNLSGKRIIGGREAMRSAILFSPKIISNTLQRVVLDQHDAGHFNYDNFSSSDCDVSSSSESVEDSSWFGSKLTEVSNVNNLDSDKNLVESDVDDDNISSDTTITDCYDDDFVHTSTPSTQSVPPTTIHISSNSAYESFMANRVKTNTSFYDYCQSLDDYEDNEKNKECCLHIDVPLNLLSGQGVKKDVHLFDSANKEEVRGKLSHSYQIERCQVDSAFAYLAQFLDRCHHVSFQKAGSAEWVRQSGIAPTFLPNNIDHHGDKADTSKPICVNTHDTYIVDGVPALETAGKLLDRFVELLPKHVPKKLFVKDGRSTQKLQVGTVAQDGSKWLEIGLFSVPGFSSNTTKLPVPIRQLFGEMLLFNNKLFEAILQAHPYLPRPRTTKAEKEYLYNLGECLFIPIGDRHHLKFPCLSNALGFQLSAHVDTQNDYRNNNQYFLCVGKHFSMNNTPKLSLDYLRDCGVMTDSFMLNMCNFTKKQLGTVASNIDGSGVVSNPIAREIYLHINNPLNCTNYKSFVKHRQLFLDHCNNKKNCFKSPHYPFIEGVAREECLDRGGGMISSDVNNIFALLHDNREFMTLRQQIELALAAANECNGTYTFANYTSKWLLGTYNDDKCFKGYVQNNGNLYKLFCRESRYQSRLMGNKYTHGCCKVHPRAQKPTPHFYQKSYVKEYNAWEKLALAAVTELMVDSCVKSCDIISVCNSFFDNMTAAKIVLPRGAPGTDLAVMAMGHFAQQRLLHILGRIHIVSPACGTYGRVQPNSGPYKFILSMLENKSDLTGPKALVVVRQKFEETYHCMRKFNPQLTRDILEQCCCLVHRLRTKLITGRKTRKKDVFFYDVRNNQMQNFFHLRETTKNQYEVCVLYKGYWRSLTDIHVPWYERDNVDLNDTMLFQWDVNEDIEGWANACGVQTNRRLPQEPWMKD